MKVYTTCLRSNYFVFIPNQLCESEYLSLACRIHPFSLFQSTYKHPFLSISVNSENKNKIKLENALDFQNNRWQQENDDYRRLPFITRPNTVCLPSNHGVGTVVIKN
jgi:hypothetical protein